ncbi:MAG: FtsX-like permease family protein [Bacteroidia bacterium]|nr:FtsX-like permease family protein [Bacteroidia bacterium]
MNFEYFFAKRITFKTQRAASGLVVRLSILSIALAVATMEVALSVVQGFQTEIQNKVVGFGSHIQIGNYYHEEDTEILPLPKNEPAIDSVRALPEVVSVSPYVFRTSLFNSERGWDGVLLKGVDKNYDWGFFSSVLKEGSIPDYSGPEESLQILVSRKQARNLDLRIGDKARLMFLPAPPRRRQVEIAGIYETGMEEFDNNIMICDMRLLQKIWRWQEDQVSGFEVNLSSLEKIEETTLQINEITPFQFGAEPITYLYREIFDWLELQHQNVWFILILMVIVAIINMTSVMLIVIIERTRMVGILKAMGLPAFRVRRMFIWNALFLVTIGVVLGNILGLGLIGLQDAFGWFRLNQEDYFIETVPIAWVWWRFLGVNAAVIGICTLAMLIPTTVINRITPLQAIRFE